MADIQVFNHPEFGSIRTLDDGGRTLFCGADIAKALGYSNALTRKDTDQNALMQAVKTRIREVQRGDHP